MRVWVGKEVRPLYERASWTRDTELKKHREAKWKEKRWYDKVARDFALSKARFEPDEEDLWECGALLGRGSFGVVGLWHKYGQRGEVLDSVAIKQTEAPHWEVDKGGQPTVPWEVVLMNGLEARGCKNVTDLRKVNFFKLEKPQVWRLYMEVCKMGTLRSLVKYYKQERSDRIPEPFIWQLLRDMARTVEHMSKIRFDGFENLGKHPFVLHLDLKDENILLGNAPDKKDGMNYPMLKVADWGLAEYTSMSSKDNSDLLRKHGTICWMPPEQRRKGHYGRKWRKNVFGGSAHPFTMAHAIWSAGAIIYGLMRLDVDNRDLNTKVNEMEDHEDRLRKWDYSVLGPRGSYKSGVYSKALCALVERCLLLDPKLRPSVSSFLELTERGWEPYYRDYVRRGYRNAEILHVHRDSNIEG